MSTKALVFPSEEALVAALTSELVPARVQRQAARYWLGSDGTIFVRPGKTPDRDVLRGLQDAGVQWTAAGPGRGHRTIEARVWPAIVSPRPVAESEVPQGRTVLFYMDAAAPGPWRTLIDLAAELLRLRCDRCSYQLLDGEHGRIALMRAFEPPYYTLAACGEGDAGYRAFVPVRSGQTRTWIELGYQHPLAHVFEPPEGHIGIITKDGAWLDLPDGPWHDFFEFVELTVPAAAHAYTPVPPPGKLTIELRLTSATRNESPSLWIVRQDAVDQIESLVTVLPDSIIARLLFATLGPDSDPMVVLRARLGRDGPPQLDIAGTAMVPLLGIANLYVPHDAMIEPPLRRDTLRALLAPDDARLYWLAPGQNREQTGDWHPARGLARGFRVESAPDRAFLPLADWVEYVVHRSAEELAPWVRAVTFEFESFQSIGAEWAQEPQPEIPDPSERRAQKSAPGAASAGVSLSGQSHADIAIPDSPAAQDMAPGESEASARYRASSVDIELAALERAFLDSDAPADAPSRTEMWLSMARLLVQSGRPKDASLCFVRAIWELARADCLDILDEWARAEAATMAEPDPAVRLWRPVYQSGTPDPDQVRAVAVQWIATVFAGRPLPPATAGSPAIASEREPGRESGRARRLIQQWFDTHGSMLDVRTSWLLGWALAEYAGGDPLGLARTRDRLLQSMRGGLSLTRDVPTFLRFLGHPGGGDSVAVAQLASSLESLVGLYDRTRRQRSASEAPASLTRAYVHLVIAYGLARLGQSERAVALRDQAARRLGDSDPVHGFLVRAYAARIDQALEGLPPETPLPADVTTMLNALEDGKGDTQLARYKVDRLRQASSILEPHERIDAIHGFLRRRSSVQNSEFAALRGLAADELATEMARLLEVAMNPATAPDERARLFDGLMDFFPMLPDSRAVPALRRILGALGDIEASPRVLLLEEALMLAGYFGRDALAGDIARSIATLVAELAAGEAESLAPAFGACLRSLRRVGLRDRAAALIDALSVKVTGDSVSALEARLHLAAGLAHLGHFEQAAPILAQAREVLHKTEFRVIDQRLRLVRALALALAECPQEQAIEGLDSLAQELSKITDHYNTNTHFCLSVIAFMEALVLGYAKSELALGELGRRWLDEDEYLVRRRIHHDLGQSP